MCSPAVEPAAYTQYMQHKCCVSHELTLLACLLQVLCNSFGGCIAAAAAAACGAWGSSLSRGCQVVAQAAFLVSSVTDAYAHQLPHAFHLAQLCPAAVDQKVPSMSFKPSACMHGLSDLVGAVPSLLSQLPCSC
jgi:hypothetical protein